MATMPNLVGKTATEAITALTDAGLGGNSRGGHGVGPANGDHKIVSQTPAAGTQVDGTVIVWGNFAEPNAYYLGTTVVVWGA